ncbi:TonB-dependent siderophore receptor [Sphingomonas sp.]
MPLVPSRRSLLLANIALVALASPAYGREPAAASAAQSAQGDIEAGEREIVVVGTPQERYRIEDSSALTGFPVDFLELPRIISVIPEQLILDQKITDLSEALRNTPGVALADGFGGTRDDFFIRGFRRNAIYRNGFRRDSIFRENLTNVEYIQVIRGPASTTYGQVQPGGIVDIVTKKPLDTPRVLAEARYGSFDDRLLLLDVSQPLGDGAAIRVVGSTQDANSFRDFTDISRDSLSISGRFDLGPSTEFFASYEYRDESRPLDRGTITIPTSTGRQIVNNVLDIPISRRFGEEYEVFANTFHFAEAVLTQRFGGDWKADLAVAYERSDSDDLQARPAGVVIVDANAPIVNGVIAGPIVPGIFDDPTDRVFLARRADGTQDRRVEAFFANARVSGGFSTGALRHRVAFGFDYREQDASRFFVVGPTAQGRPTAAGGNGLPLFDIQNPVYGTLPFNPSTAGLAPIDNEINERIVGFFLNDYIEWGNLGLLVGIRHDIIDNDGGGPIESRSAWSPQVGLNYRVTDQASLFASYSEGFLPNTALSDVGATLPFDPEQSRQIEFGGKVELAQRRLQASLAYFDIEKSNVLISVDGVPALRDGQSAKGVELAVTGQPVDGMNVVLGYSYLDSTLAGGAIEGNRPLNVPEHNFSLWASYEFQTGSLQGLGLGGGIFHTGNRFDDDANTWDLGSYTLIDASLWYTIPVRLGGRDGGVRLQVTGKNLTDETYFPASGGNERINIGAPASVIGSVSLLF